MKVNDLDQNPDPHFLPVLPTRIQIHRILMFFGLPDQDPLVGGVRRGPDRIGSLGKPQLAQHSYRQEPVAVLAFLGSPHTNAGMKQYKCVRTQPLLSMGHDRGKTSGRNLKS